MNEDIVKSPYYYLSKYRSVLMGLAILWVTWHHSSVRIDFLPIGNSVFAFLKQVGYSGVDLFLLISGMGIYNSLEKNSISKFIKNRVVRIIPVWWINLLITVLFKQFVFQISMSKLEILGFATFTGYWLNMSYQGNWYVYAIMLFYLISPVFHSLIKGSKKKLSMCIILVIVSIIVSIPFFNDEKLIVFSRVPIYIVGMYISASLRNSAIKKKHWIALISAFAFGLFLLIICYKFFYAYLWLYGLWWYPFIIIAPTLLLLIAKCIDNFQCFLRPLLFVLSILGKSSLEILLVSSFLFTNFSKLSICIINNRITSIFVVIISLAFGIVFHYGVEYATKRIKLRKS